jgi:beta-mannanase
MHDQQNRPVRPAGRKSLLSLVAGGFLAISLLVPYGATSAGAVVTTSAAVSAPSAVTSTAIPNQKTACAYTANNLSLLQQFGWLVGRQLDCAVVFNDTASTWADWSNPWFLHAPVADTQFAWPAWLRSGSRTLVVTQSMVPTGTVGDWRSLGASGAYDDQIRALGASLVAGGAGSAIIRLGHEANGEWYYDSIGTTTAERTAWAAYWAHFSSVLKSTPASHFELDWTVNAGYRPVPFDDYYPGDAAVDIVGIDQYDSVSPGTGTVQPLRWNTLLNQPYGLKALADFAVAHGKPLSIPEWGVMDPTIDPNGGGDDAYYVDQIALLVRNNNVRYQSYFNVVVGGTAQLQTMAGARASWKRHFGATGDSLGGSTPVPTATVTPPPTVPAPSGPPRVAGDTKRVCVDSQASLAKLQSFVWMVGRPIYCAALSNTTPATWSAWETPWQLTMSPSAYPDYQWPKWVADGQGTRTVVLTQSIIPQGMPSDWRQQGAAGAYDAHATALAAHLVAAGMGSAVIRLSPKGNGDWNMDSIGSATADMTAWKAYWARIVTAMRAVPGAHFTFDWSINGNYRPIAFDSYYPGDSYVDVIGIAQYDSAATAVGLSQPARFNSQLGAIDGLAALVAYAKAHGKPLSISEWGLVDAARSGGGGDDGYFVDQLAALVAGNVVSYQTWEETTANGGLPLVNASSGRAAWKRHFGTGGNASDSG